MISAVTITEENFQLFREEILHIENTSFVSPWTIQSFAEEVVRPVSRLLGMKAGSCLVGYICFWVFANEIHLMKMAIHPEMRGKGFGFFLLARMIEAGRSEQAEKVWLEVRASNNAAKGLYAKTGFKEIGRRRGYYSHGKEDAVVMALNMVDFTNN